jgi:hypothetical protein
MSADPNPYESPRVASQHPFTEATAIAELERRVAALETQLARSWFSRPGFFYRVFAVWGYLMAGYVLFAAIAFPLIWLLDWLGIMH